MNWIVQITLLNRKYDLAYGKINHPPFIDLQPWCDALAAGRPNGWAKSFKWSVNGNEAMNI